MRIGAFRIGVVIPPEKQKLFKKNEWNSAFRAAMINAGRTFVATRLPPRFGPFAKTLGYNAKKTTNELTVGEQMRIALWMMRRDGSYDRLVKTHCARWGGWNPLKLKPGPPDHIWKTWIRDAIASKKVDLSRSGEWRTARKKMQEEALRETRIKERLRLYAQDEYIDEGLADEPVPLVASGALLKNHQKWATVKATATANSQTLTIAVPRGQRTHKQVNKVLGNYTESEAETVRDDVSSSISRWIDGATITTNRKKASSATFSAEAMRQIKSANRAGGHKNRTTKGASPREVA